MQAEGVVVSMPAFDVGNGRRGIEHGGHAVLARQPQPLDGGRERLLELRDEKSAAAICGSAARMSSGGSLAAAPLSIMMALSPFATKRR
jgi:hypothetical protein